MEKASAILPPVSEKANNPWISPHTLDLLSQRRLARVRNDYEKEQRLHKAARASAKKDRTVWLDKMLEDGDWTQVRKLRNPKRAKFCKLRGQGGELVESDKWADTMADHLEKLQWRVRPMGDVSGPQLGPTLPVLLENFTESEVDLVLKKLKTKRASGPDEIPAEFWKALGRRDAGLTWITEMVNRCWHDECLPDEWHHADVTAIYKKGPVKSCENYRPISLICVAYKIFASLLLKRLQSAGSPQFGFRRGRGTNDGIFAVRRIIDQALAQRNGKVAMLALDWAKAFDSINIEALMQSLSRFGLPAKILRILKHIYEDRSFCVTNSGENLHAEGSTRESHRDVHCHRSFLS